MRLQMDGKFRFCVWVIISFCSSDIYCNQRRHAGNFICLFIWYSRFDRYSAASQSTNNKFKCSYWFVHLCSTKWILCSGGVLAYELHLWLSLNHQITLHFTNQFLLNDWLYQAWYLKQDNRFNKFYGNYFSCGFSHTCQHNANIIMSTTNRHEIRVWVINTRRIRRNSRNLRECNGLLDDVVHEYWNNWWPQKTTILLTTTCSLYTKIQRPSRISK